MAACGACRRGDVLVVWKLDHLGRNLAHLVNIVQDPPARGVGPAGARRRGRAGRHHDRGRPPRVRHLCGAGPVRDGAPRHVGTGAVPRELGIRPVTLYRYVDPRHLNPKTATPGGLSRPRRRHRRRQIDSAQIAEHLSGRSTRHRQVVGEVPRTARRAVGGGIRPARAGSVSRRPRDQESAIKREIYDFAVTNCKLR